MAVTLAVVGSVRITPDDERAPYAAALIVEAIETLQPNSITSGGAIGIDSLAADIARAYHVPLTEFLPENARWAPRGYRDRNIKIARTATHLLRIAARESHTYGSGWTADHAEQHGAHVVRVTL